jgi:DNA-binding NarL/FixJ family response regulator
VLMDIRMPVMDGIEATDRIRKAYPKTKIIAFSQYDNDSNILEMNIHGVKSFIGKNDDPKELFNAIRIVNSGGVYMTNYSAEIIQKYLSTKTKSQLPLLSQRLTKEELIEKFNKTELLILKYVSNRTSIKEIAKQLFLSPNTINNKQADLRKKLNIRGKGKLLEYVLSIKQHLNQLNEW